MKTGPLQKVVYELNTIPTKSQMALFTALGKKLLEFIQKHKILQIASAMLKRLTKLSHTHSQGTL